MNRLTPGSGRHEVAAAWRRIFLRLRHPRPQPEWVQLELVAPEIPVYGRAWVWFEPNSTVRISLSSEGIGFRPLSPNTTVWVDSFTQSKDGLA